MGPNGKKNQVTLIARTNKKTTRPGMGKKNSKV